MDWTGVPSGSRWGGDEVLPLSCTCCSALMPPVSRRAVPRDKTALQDEVTALRAQLAAVQPLLAGSRDPHVARHFAGPSRAGGAAAAAAPASSSGRHAAGAGAAASAAAAPSASGREVAAPKGPGAAAAAAAACFARAGSSTAVASFSGRGAAGASNGGDAPSAAAGRSGGSSGDAACTSGRGSPALSASASMLELTAAKVLRRERSGSGPHADGAGTSGAGADDANVHDGWGDDFWQAVGASGSGADGDAAAAADCGADACACSGADSGVANGDDDCTAGEPNDDGGPEEDGALVIDDFDDLPLQRPRAFGNVGSGGAAAPPRFAAIHQSNKSVKNWLAPAAPSVASYFAAPPAWPFGGGGGGGGLIRSGADGRGGMTHVLADATNLMLKRVSSQCLLFHLDTGICKPPSPFGGARRWQQLSTCVAVPRRSACGMITAYWVLSFLPAQTSAALPVCLIPT